MPTHACGLFQDWDLSNPECRFESGLVLHAFFEVNIFLAKASSKCFQMKVGCYVDLCVSAPLPNHTNPELSLILAVIAILKPIPKVWVASVSLTLFFLLFTHFTTFRRSLLKDFHLRFLCFDFENLDLFFLRVS